jgi:2'-5' RNA ligase
MARVRLGVALLIEEPWRTEINGLRRALGDKNLERIPPHITLIPPINLRVEDRQLAFDIVRKAAENTKPFDVVLGPVTSFAPKTPVIKLDVQGEGRARIVALRDALATGPLAREPQWPFDPHVTLNDEASDELIAHAVAMTYEISTSFSDIFLLRQYDDRVWRPYVDSQFGPPVTIGTGGIAIAISRTTFLEPTVAECLGLEDEPTTLVLTARIDGTAVGALLLDGLDLRALRVLDGHRGQGIGSHLLRHAYFVTRREIVDCTGDPDVAGLLRRFS